MVLSFLHHVDVGVLPPADPGLFECIDDEPVDDDDDICGDGDDPSHVVTYMEHLLDLMLIMVQKIFLIVPPANNKFLAFANK